MSEDLIGKTLGKYELRERIGRGGMAEVYKGYHAALDRNVAIKILHPFLGEDPAFKERFETEARNIAKLRHPNIVQVYDFDHDDRRDLYYMVMEYIGGPTLSARLMALEFQGLHFTVMEAVSITRKLADALAYAHSRGMVHRDIKPGNVMFDADGRVVLTDFGIARIVSGPSMTASGSMVGTPAYMSPEQGLGQSGDHRSDIYSLGVVLYQLVTGTIPFGGDTPIAIVLKHVNDPLPPPSNLNPDIPDGLERIIYKALSKAPEDRYQQVEEMAAHLDDLELASTIVIPAPGHPVARPEPPGGGPPAAEPEEPAEAEAAPAAEISSAPAAGRGRGGACLNWTLLLTLAFAAMAAGIYLALTGMLNTYLPFAPETEFVLTDTPTPLPTATPDAAAQTEMPLSDPQATQISLTLQALTTLIATPLSTQNPGIDLTATALACDYDYEIVEQTPADGAAYPELTTLTKRITIVNDSRCPLDDDTRLVFLEGAQLEGPGFIEFERALAPGERFEIVLELRTPPYSADNPAVQSTWFIQQPDGTRVGRPLTFGLVIFASAPSGATPTERP